MKRLDKVGNGVAYPGVETPAKTEYRPETDKDKMERVVVLGNEIVKFKRQNERLRQSEERYRHLVEYSPEAMIVHRDGLVVYANPAADKLLAGCFESGLVGVSIFDLVLPHERELVRQRTTHAMERAGNTIESMEHTLSFPNAQFVVEVSGVGILYDGYPAVQLFIRDITARKENQRAKKRTETLLRGQNKVLNLIVHGVPLAEVLTEIVHQVEALEANVACGIYVKKSPHRLLVAPNIPDGKLEDLDLCFPSVSEDGRDVVRGWSEGWVWSRPLLNPSGEPMGCFVVHSETDRRELEKDFELYEVFGPLAALAITQRISEDEITYLAYHDALTGLPNRRVVEAELDKIHSLADSSTSCTVMMLDVDRFKSINDTFGHEFGNRVVKVVASRLRGCVEKNDIVSRVGGDEFIILLAKRKTKEDANLVAHRIRLAMEEVVHIDGHEFSLTTSVGVAFYPEHGTSLDDLLKNADSAMYHAKGQGRNCVATYHPDMNQKLFARLILERDIREAIRKNRFSLHYQPKVNIKTGAVTGAEALIRWYHAERGFIAPEEFIPVAEETGSIVPIGEWVLENVLRQLKRWGDAGKPMIPIAVNVSAQQLVRPSFAAFVREALARHSIDPKWLELEITETAILTNEEVASRTIRELADTGVTMTLDDFGTGYSSLSFLTRFEISSIKIDQSFVNGLLRKDSVSENIMISLVSLAQSLEMKVVAEGVESADQLRFLQERNCDEAQGYLFSKPMSFAMFEAFFTNATAREAV